MPELEKGKPITSKIENIDKSRLTIEKTNVKIDQITQIVDLIEDNKITLMEILDEWYLRRIG